MSKRFALLATLSLLLLLTNYEDTTAQAPDGLDARADAGVIAGRLADKDPLARQSAAEALATLAAVDQRKLLEGYRLQEKDKRVRLALHWALYRIGKQEFIYDIVRELDSGRHEQAIGYLAQLDSPSVLNQILQREKNAPRIKAGIVSALAQIGDNESLELIKPLRESLEPGVAAAAELATDEIEKRLAGLENTTALPSRPRAVSTAEKP